MRDAKEENKEEQVIKAIKCDFCGVLHAYDSEEYLSFVGNVCVGENGGIIGNNLDKDLTVIRKSRYCRKRECLGVLLNILR